jgi:hypothetical protein
MPPADFVAYPQLIMKNAKGILYAVIGAGALVSFGWYFLSSLQSGGSARTGEPAGVLLSPPTGYEIVELGETSPVAAAAELEARALSADAGKVGVHFTRQGAEVYWLADARENLLEERSAGASGTRLQTVWRGGIRERLSWAKTRGIFETPGQTPGERVNLYH